MITAKIYLKLCLIFFVSTLCFAEGVSPELTQKEYEYLLKNHLIIRYNDVKESAWPEVTIFKLIKAQRAVIIFFIFPQIKRAKGFPAMPYVQIFLNLKFKWAS